jgi:hypothetical protein
MRRFLGEREITDRSKEHTDVLSVMLVTGTNTTSPIERGGSAKAYLCLSLMSKLSL